MSRFGVVVTEHTPSSNVALLVGSPLFSERFLLSGNLVFLSHHENSCYNLSWLNMICSFPNYPGASLSLRLAWNYYLLLFQLHQQLACTFIFSKFIYVNYKMFHLSKKTSAYIVGCVYLTPLVLGPVMGLIVVCS